MKLSLKLIVGISSLIVIATAGVFATTSCSKANKFADYKTGDKITLKSKSDANKLVEIALLHLYPYRGIDNSIPTDVPTIVFKLWTNDSNEQYACNQIYWELAYTLAQNVLKYNPKPNVEMNITDDNSAFLTTPLFSPAASTDKLQIKYATSKKNVTTINGNLIISYPAWYNDITKEPTNQLPTQIQLMNSDDNQVLYTANSYSFKNCYWAV